MRDIYSSVPVNKVAAIVIGQSGCASDDTLNNEQLRENLVSRWKKLQSELLLLPKKSLKRKALGQEMQGMQDKINEIRPAKKAKGVEGYFIDAAREALTKPQFDILMGKAVKMMREVK